MESRETESQGEAPPESDLFRMRGASFTAQRESLSLSRLTAAWSRGRQELAKQAAAAEARAPRQLPGCGPWGPPAPQHRGRRGVGGRWSAAEGHTGVRGWDKVLGLGFVAPPELGVLINQNLGVNFSSIRKFFIYHY